MTFSWLALHCLNAVCDDYEDLTAIHAQVCRDTQRHVNVSEVEACVAELAAKGMIAVFVYDAEQARYVPRDHSTVGGPNRWFFITQEGRIALDQSWAEEE